jgi:hypothetical protein
MTRPELNHQSAACRHCDQVRGYYCSYHAAWNALVVAMEGQAMIRRNLAAQQPAQRPSWSAQFEPVTTLVLTERLVATIAVAKLRKQHQEVA